MFARTWGFKSPLRHHKTAGQGTYEAAEMTDWSRIGHGRFCAIVASPAGVVSVGAPSIQHGPVPTMTGEEHVGIVRVVMHDAIPPPGSVGRTQYSPRCGTEVAGAEAAKVPCGCGGEVVPLMVVSLTCASATVVVPPVAGVAGV